MQATTKNCCSIGLFDGGNKEKVSSSQALLKCSSQLDVSNVSKLKQIEQKLP